MTRAVPPRRRRSGEDAIGVPDMTPVVVGCPEPSANDTTAAKWDPLDIATFVDALAEYTADLLGRGPLDDLLAESERKRPSDRKIAFTSARPPSIK
jgi:hypothetical protein